MNRDFSAENRGFTLLEVLIALLVLATALSAMIRGGAESASAAAYLRDKTIAGWVAQNEFNRLIIHNKRLDKGTHNGDAEMAGQRWFWTTTVVPHATMPGVVQEYSVSVRKNRNDKGAVTTITAYLAAVPALTQ